MDPSNAKEEPRKNPPPNPPPNQKKAAENPLDIILIDY
jgi:hypothetical protein